jgi:hypothetical protein
MYPDWFYHGLEPQVSIRWLGDIPIKFILPQVDSTIHCCLHIHCCVTILYWSISECSQGTWSTRKKASTSTQELCCNVPSSRSPGKETFLPTCWRGMTRIVVQEPPLQKHQGQPLFLRSHKASLHADMVVANLLAWDQMKSTWMITWITCDSQDVSAKDPSCMMHYLRIFLWCTTCSTTRSKNVLISCCS